MLNGWNDGRADDLTADAEDSPFGRWLCAQSWMSGCQTQTERRGMETKNIQELVYALLKT